MLGMNWIDNYLKAGNVETSEEQLTLLAQSENHRIRMRVAENSRTPKKVLEQLALDNEADVRLAVACNPSCPHGLLLRLAGDEDATVRHGLAEDPDTAIDVLEILSGDSNPYVSCRARKTIQSLCHARPGESHRIYLWPGRGQERYA